MTDTVKIDQRATAVKDDEVWILVDRFVAWLSPTKDYSKMQVGPTCTPLGSLIVRIPVAGAKEGEPLTPEQFAEVMRATAAMVEPAALSFATLVANDFGYELPEPAPESDF